MGFDDDLTMWTIYEHPRDFPDGYMVRPWTVTRSGPVPGMAAVCASLEDARAVVPAGLYRMDRQPDDDPAILETWL